MMLHSIDEALFSGPFYESFSSIFNLVEISKFVIAIYLLFRFFNISKDFFSKIKK